MSNLSAIEIAKDLGIPKRTVQSYCHDGFLPAVVTLSRGKPKYEVENHKYLEWKRKHFKGVKRGNASKYTREDKELTIDELKKVSEDWLEWCVNGKLSGKPMGARTVEIYRYYFNLYLDRLGKYPSKPLISITNLREVLGSYKPENFSTKRNIYDAVMSITKYFIENQKMKPETRDAMKALKPKRFLPPKKTSLTEQQINKLLSTIETMNSSAYDKLTAKTIIVFLANTGLRASEFCKLKLEDVDLEHQKLYVKLGKGNKNRIVGINTETYNALLDYLKARSKNDSDYFFVNRLGEPFTVTSLSKKVSHLAKRVNLASISPHSLRRSFVTINANKGKPINHLRLACGHADISTTQSYCMTSVDEVVEAMRGW
jgi:integrase